MFKSPYTANSEKLFWFLTTTLIAVVIAYIFYNQIRAINKLVNDLCFTVVVLNLNKFLIIDFNKQTLHKKEVFH